MKKLIILIGVVLFCVACSGNRVPDGIIKKDKMLNVMLDMQLTDGYLNQVNHPDTLRMEAHSRYNYIFKKYNIDSVKFSNSLKYYSLKPQVLDEMYTTVSDSLTRLEERLKPAPVNNDTEMRAQEIQAYVLRNFTRDSAKFSNANYYRVDAKKLYKSYTQMDSLKRLNDSLKLKQLHKEENKKLNQETKVKNDISTE